MKKIKNIPPFKNEDEEREFWATHDTSDYFDVKKPVKLDLSNLKRSTKPVTVRLPEDLIKKLKILANKKDVPYQSLLKLYLDEKVKEEWVFV
jgi:predicted DNA binding CopG/RHH family protein